MIYSGVVPAPAGVITSLLCYSDKSMFEKSGASDPVFPVLFQAYKYIKTRVPPEPDRHRY